MTQNYFEPEPDVDMHAHGVEFGDTRAHLAVQMLKKMRESITHVISLLETGDSQRATRHLVDLVAHQHNVEAACEAQTGSRVVEGVFDGVGMIGSDGARYEVSPNYASKSRLVEGDVLKLTIQSDGGYLYKQIGPVQRQRVIGKLHFDASGCDHVVHANNQVYKVLTTSISYYKAVPGDEVVIMIPKDGVSKWAAIENIV